MTLVGNKGKSKFPDSNRPVALSAKNSSSSTFTPAQSTQLSFKSCSQLRITVRVSPEKCIHTSLGVHSLSNTGICPAQPLEHHFSQGWEHSVSRDRAGPALPQAAFPMEFSTINTSKTSAKEHSPCPCVTCTAEAEHSKLPLPLQLPKPKLFQCYKYIWYCWFFTSIKINTICTMLK